MRKKDDDFHPQVQRLRDLVDKIQKEMPSLNDKKMAKQLGYSAVNFSRVLNERRGISDRFIQRFSREYGVDPDYLRMTADAPWLGRKPVSAAPSDQQEVSIPQDIKMAIEVLESGTHFAEALRTDIHCFHRATILQREYGKLLAGLKTKRGDIKNRQ